MPEDSKKNDKKNAKDQRKPRQRHQQGRAEKKPEKVEEPKSAPKVTVPQGPPVYESPPPEFFKNLKRETDEILKITEEENSKYKKKEIQSNWSKYELPVESYEDIEEQENLGADYEKLIAAPLSVGGHFQFKHEKSWDLNTGPSLYDKYFEINMDDLNTAICTIPFHERNAIEESIFNEADISTMSNRATRFKQKYFNDKSFTTPEIEAQDKILNSLRDSVKSDENSTKNIDITNTDTDIKSDVDNSPAKLTKDEPNLATDINLDFKNEPHSAIDSNKVVEEKLSSLNIEERIEPVSKANDPIINDEIEHDDFIFGNTVKAKQPVIEKPAVVPTSTKVPDVKVEPRIEVKKTASPVKVATPVRPKPTAVPTVAATPVEAKKNPVIESPEDLEKWLDDFLDG